MMKGDGNMKALVNIMFALVFIYTAGVLALCWLGVNTPDSLTYSFYAFMAADGGAMAWIKVKKSASSQNDKSKDRSKKAAKQPNQTVKTSLWRQLPRPLRQGLMLAARMGANK